MLQCRGMLQVKVSHKAPPSLLHHGLDAGSCPLTLWVCHFFAQGKGDMVTYWLEGKKMSLVPRDISQDAKTTKSVNMETETGMEKERELYSSIPGFLNDDLLSDRPDRFSSS